MNASKKYARSLHARISLGTTSDDRFMPKGYLSAFATLPELVVTEKLDGQNNCLSKHGVFARSHAALSQLPWDRPLQERWQRIKGDLGDLELFGENMFGLHSIGYRGLESYFYLFAVRERGRWLSWEEVELTAAMFDFPTVPVIVGSTRLPEQKLPYADEDQVLSTWLQAILGMDWRQYVQSPGALQGYDPATGADACEGLVIRNAASFETNSGLLPVAWNEFDSLFKLVRKGHVQTDEHWTRNWKAAQLCDYERYHWYGYHYLGRA